MTLVYLNLTRFCFIVPYAVCIEKNNDKKSSKKILPSYPNLFEHVTTNTFFLEGLMREREYRLLRKQAQNVFYYCYFFEFGSHV